MGVHVRFVCVSFLSFGEKKKNFFLWLSKNLKKKRRERFLREKTFSLRAKKYQKDESVFFSRSRAKTNLFSEERRVGATMRTTSDNNNDDDDAKKKKKKKKKRPPLSRRRRRRRRRDERSRCFMLFVVVFSSSLFFFFFL